MSKQTIIGKYKDGSETKIDIDRLIDTRLLVQASSGGGKSYAIRKLVEEIYGKVQIIILDIEGDFATLREKYDFVLAGKGGDIIPDPRYSEQLARKVLELKTDIICDLYELKMSDRITFVKKFLNAMIDAPKELWHPVVVVLDEAHIFAPESGKCESLDSVCDLSARGRKRGYCLVLATQRPAKISKDAIAECQNIVVGLANREIDRKRGAEELGFTDRATILTLRDMAQGEFYAVGPAFSLRGVNLMNFGEVKTTHPKRGSGGIGKHAPAPTEKVKAQLAKLADIPRQAEEEIKDVAALRTRIRELERNSKTGVIDADAIEKAYRKGVIEVEHKFRNILSDFKAFTINVSSKANILLESLKISEEKPVHKQISKPVKQNLPIDESPRVEGISVNLGQCEKRILGFLSLHPGKFFTRNQIGVLTGYAHSSGGFNNAISKLSQAQFIERQSGNIALRKDADVSGYIDGQPHSLNDWIQKLSKCESEIYKKILESPTETFSRDELGELTNYSSGSGGFNNAISRLNTLGLMKKHSDGKIGLNPEVYELI